MSARMTWIFMMLFAGLFASAIWTYNQLVKHRNRVDEAWSGIDVQLKRRHDLVPNLATAVQAYAGHEKRVLEELTHTRTETQRAIGVQSMQAAESKLSGAMVHAFGLAESYPDLKAAQNFIDLHQRLIEIEDTLQLARRYYNGAVRDNNIYVESFPSNVVARLLGFKSVEFFEIELATERLAPSLAFSDQSNRDA